jgi:LacI family transcriptional regulator
MGKKISISDIASALNISKTTISFIINGKAKEKRISDQLTEKVRRYIEENDYKPSQLEQSLTNVKTMTIGLMVEKISDYFFAQMAYHIEELAYQNGYKILYCSTDNDLEKARDLIQLFKDRLVDGYIITPPAGMEKDIQGMIDDGLPVVLFDRFYKDVESSYVVLDNYRASYNAAKYLAEKNYKNILFVELENEQSQMEDRRLGYEKAISEHQLKPIIEKVAYANDAGQTVKQLIKFLKQNKHIDAIYFATNYLAFSGVKALNQLGYKIPENIAIIAFDDHQVFDFYPPTITAVAQPISELAKQSIKVLLNMLDKPTAQRQIQKVIVPANFIVRESTSLKRQ